MTLPLEIFLWFLLGLSAAGLLHTYGLYPLSLLVIERFTRARRYERAGSNDQADRPTVTIVLAVYNGEDVIEKKINNFLQLDYSASKLSLLIGSDGSTDGTNGILQRYSSDPRIAVRFFPRGGKAKTVNALVAECTADILIFTDANTFYQNDVVGNMVRHFDDPGIGGVCGNLRLVASISNVGSVGEEKYWVVESWLKRKEGAIDSTLGATGAIYAIRRALFFEHPTDCKIADDLLLPLRIAAAGYRVIYEPGAVGFEETSNSMHQEFQRKIRNAIGTFNVIGKIRPYAANFSTFVRYAFISHKLIRWIVPFLLIGLLLATTGLLLLGREIAVPLLYVQLGIYAVAFIGLIAELLRINIGIFSLPLYFMAVNTSLLIGWFKLSSEGKKATWNPVKEK